MMRIILLSLLFGMLILSSCEKNEPVPIPESIPELSLSLVSGVNMSDENGAPIGQVGNPNNKSGDIRIFPNPLVDEANIYSIENSLVEILVLDGTKSDLFLDTDFETELENYEVSTDSIGHLKIQEFGLPSGQDNKAVSLNLSNLKEGYYRIFYKTKSGEFFWDNIKIDKTGDSGLRIQNLIDEWK